MFLKIKTNVQLPDPFFISNKGLAYTFTCAGGNKPMICVEDVPEEYGKALLTKGIYEPATADEVATAKKLLGTPAAGSNVPDGAKLNPERLLAGAVRVEDFDKMKPEEALEFITTAGMEKAEVLELQQHVAATRPQAKKFQKAIAEFVETL